MKWKFAQIIKDIDDSHFKPLPNKRLLMSKENVEQMKSNLWSMFDLKFTPEKMVEFHDKKDYPFGANVSDYAWTKTAKEKFYGHEYHKRLVSRMKKVKSMDWGMWVLNSEPSDIIEIVENN